MTATRKEITGMKNQILEKIKSIKGDTSIYYKNLVTKETIEHNTDHPFIAASVIKLPMLVVLYKYFEEGKLHKTDEIIISEAEKVGGCGAYRLMPNDILTTLEALSNTMIAISDNTATNKIMNILGIEELNKEFSLLGLEKTRINRLLFDANASANGLENYFSTRDMGMLLEKLYNKELVSPWVSKEVMRVLSLQQINHKIPSRIVDGTKILHKTGEDKNTSHDVGIILAKKPFILSFASNNVDVYEFEDFMRNTSFSLYQMHC